MTGRSRDIAGAVVLHPAALVALVVLVVNDHVAKTLWPGVLTGKASDVAGLVLAPLVLVALAEIGCEIAGRERPGAGVVVVAAALTGAGFAAVQLSPAAGSLYRHGLGAAQQLLGGDGRPVVLTPDLTDLLALPALLVPWIVAGRVRLRRDVPATPLRWRRRRHPARRA
jgi:hypothetical protein